MTPPNKKYIFESQTSEQIQKYNNCSIQPVKTLKKFKKFYQLAGKIYQNDPQWVPSFWQEYKGFFKNTNPFWTHAQAKLYLAYQNNRPVGRIAAFIDTLFIKQEQKNIGYFGFFECINNKEVAHVLFETAQQWLKKHKMDYIRGPINGRIDVGCGFLYKGFEEPYYILGTYTPHEYIEFAESFGFKKCRDLVSYYMDLGKPIPSAVKQAAEQCIKQGITVRGFNKLHATKEINWWVPLMMEQFKHHWGYVPVSEQEVRTRFGVKQARWIVDHGLFLIAEKNNTPISFKWSVPDYNQLFQSMNGHLGLINICKFYFGKHKINRGKLNFVGIKKEYRGQGIGTYMNYVTMKEMKRRGYSGAECGWIDEQNIASRRAIEKTGATLYKTFRVYEKKITTASSV